MHHLQRPDGRIAYDLQGTGNTGTLVICVPGMFDHRSSFRFVAAALAEAGHRVAVMDLRGHGDSDTTFDRYDSRATAGDVVALAEELGGRRVVVAGNSMGAAAATIAALDRPDLVSGIALLGPFLRPGVQSRLERAALRILVSGPWMARGLTMVYDSLHKGRVPEGHAEQKARVHAMLRPAERRRAVARTIGVTNETIDDASGLSARAVVIMGELDPDWKDPRAEADWVASVVRGEVVMVPDCGHYAQSQRPDVVVPALVDLIEKAEAVA
ncbi:alpha/beta fold hydrolase [Nocardiopsis prasina]|uniref:alpha/beta fold hydrolase n=1 Tax=Nocardiopsis prasina TaxID=2015 RepID=UPI0003497960|nr:alpha/beta fold hydrolase [Nocardiopsis prasina]